VSEHEPGPGFNVVDRRRRGDDDLPSKPAPPVVETPRPAPAAPAHSTVAAPSGVAPGGPGGVPKADLTSLLVMVYGDAMANMGQAPDPVSGRPHVDLEQARFAIDLLAMLQQKTHGNRTPDESAVLEEMLGALRMGFVRLSQGRRGGPDPRTRA
jgi:Domain of unknown function (DUF1844)